MQPSQLLSLRCESLPHLPTAPQQELVPGPTALWAAAWDEAPWALLIDGQVNIWGASVSHLRYTLPEL